MTSHLVELELPVPVQYCTQISKPHTPYYTHTRHAGVEVVCGNEASWARPPGLAVSSHRNVPTPACTHARRGDSKPAGSLGRAQEGLPLGAAPRVG